ncbi:MAG: type I restriction enzyme HsdR N-terminal domain-containing protein [Prevotella sp.]|nr:type I restriction enzyme HsdR N-terminal domain-containing protein [Prevotella sp.]MCM1075355.1 type I restriction enzyme HsdR N-terminal domain-containing protein [Ruminococcus sp.]
MKFPPLNLPDYPVKTRLNPEGKPEIWDPIRSKYVALTPEEYVRRRFTEWLIRDKHFPMSLMANELSLDINGLRRRADTLVADRHGAPFMVIEYKAPHVAINQEVFDQAMRYNKIFGAPYLTVSNGMAHYCCRISEDGEYHFIPEIPDWNSAMLGPIEN